MILRAIFQVAGTLPPHEKSSTLRRGGEPRRRIYARGLAEGIPTQNWGGYGEKEDFHAQNRCPGFFHAQIRTPACSHGLPALLSCLTFNVSLAFFGDAVSVAYGVRFGSATSRWNRREKLGFGDTLELAISGVSKG